MEYIELTKDSKKIIETLLQKIKSDNIVSNEELKDVDRLEKKRKEIWGKYCSFEDHYRLHTRGDVYTTKKDEFLRDMDEIDLEVSGRKADFNRRKNYVKRLKLIDSLLLFTNDISYLTCDDRKVSFDDLCYAFVKTTKKDAIDELKKKKEVMLLKLSFNEHKSVNMENRFYLAEKDKENIMIEIEDDNRLINIISETEAKRQDLNGNNFNLMKLLKDNAYQTYNAIYSSSSSKQQDKTL